MAPPGIPADVIKASIRLSADSCADTVDRPQLLDQETEAGDGQGPERSPVRRSRVDGEPVFSRDPARLLGAMRIRAIACRTPGCRCQAGREGVPWAEPVTGRSRPHEFPVSESGRDEASLRDRGYELAAGCAQSRAGCRAEQGTPPTGRQQRIHRRREPRDDARQSGVPQRADGAAAVRAPDRHRARDSTAVQPAMDQQVLHHGPGTGPQLHRVGDQAQQDSLCDQLPQSRRTRCTAPPWTTTSFPGRGKR